MASENLRRKLCVKNLYLGSKTGRESRRLNFPLLCVKRELRFYFLNTRAFMNMRKFIEAYPRPTFQPNNGPVEKKKKIVI